MEVIGPDRVTQLLHLAAARNAAAEEELLRILYQELHHLAGCYMRNERPNHTLQPTALVHEAYLRLLHADDARQWNNRVHFLASASTVMRHVLVDHARRRRAGKRGDGVVGEPLPADQVSAQSHTPERILAIDIALSRLAAIHPRQARVVELRFFAGMNHDEIASLLGISSRTVKREWMAAKAWLYHELAS
jgi:RNA polymerase sigma-70 factor (ECF subfamily)